MKCDSARWKPENCLVGIPAKRPVFGDAWWKMLPWLLLAVSCVFNVYLLRMHTTAAPEASQQKLMDPIPQAHIPGRSLSCDPSSPSRRASAASPSPSPSVATASTAGSTASSSSSGHHGGHKHDALLFLFNALVIGTGVTHLTTIPAFSGLQHTVVVFVLGLLYSLIQEGLGFKEDSGVFGDSYDMWMSIDPHLLLFSLLPPLLAGDAMAIDTQVAKRVANQCMYLAGPGVLIQAMLCALFFRWYFDWSFLLSLVTGAILCATDPVAVVGLLKELGASPTLTVTIQGESLLNDGTAIVLFTVAYNMLKGDDYDASDIVMYMIKTCLMAVALGLFIGYVFFVWIRQASNRLDHRSSIIQISLTLCCAYWSFILAEGVLHISGVLCTVFASLILADKMWPHIVCQEAMHHVWHTFEALGNTVIFFLAGALTGNAMLKIDSEDYLHLVVIYIVLTLIRGSMIFLSRPVLRRLTADKTEVTKASAAVMTWGGLRGAVGLALAIQVRIARAEDGSGNFKISQQDAERVLFFVGGIAFLTIVINSTTCPLLVHVLGISATPESKKRVLRMIHRQLVRHTRTKNYPKEVTDSLDRILLSAIHDIDSTPDAQGRTSVHASTAKSARNSRWNSQLAGDMFSLSRSDSQDLDRAAGLYEIPQDDKHEEKKGAEKEKDMLAVVPGFAVKIPAELARQYSGSASNGWCSAAPVGSPSLGSSNGSGKVLLPPIEPPPGKPMDPPPGILPATPDQIDRELSVPVKKTVSLEEPPRQARSLSPNSAVVVVKKVSIAAAEPADSRSSSKSKDDADDHPADRVSRKSAGGRRTAFAPSYRVADFLKRMSAGRRTTGADIALETHRLLQELQEGRETYDKLSAEDLQLLGELPEMFILPLEARLCSLIASHLDDFDGEMMEAVNGAFLSIVQSQYWKSIEHRDLVPGTKEADVLLMSIQVSRSKSRVHLTDYLYILPHVTGGDRGHRKIAEDGSYDSEESSFNGQEVAWLNRCLNSAFFHTLMAVAIVLNGIYIAIEERVRNSSNDDSLSWLVIEIIFTAVFTIEFLLKLIGQKCRYFMDGWNCFDFVLVVLGIFGIFSSVAARESDVSDNADVSGEVRIIRIAKVFRVMRLLRLFRLIKVFQILQAKLQRQELSLEIAENMQRMTTLVGFIKAHLLAQAQFYRLLCGEEAKVCSLEVARCMLQSQLYVYQALTLAIANLKALDKVLLQQVNNVRESKRITEELEHFILSAWETGVISLREAESVLHPLHDHIRQCMLLIKDSVRGVSRNLKEELVSGRKTQTFMTSATRTFCWDWDAAQSMQQSTMSEDEGEDSAAMPYATKSLENERVSEFGIRPEEFTNRRCSAPARCSAPPAALEDDNARQRKKSEPGPCTGNPYQEMDEDGNGWMAPASLPAKWSENWTIDDLK